MVRHESVGALELMLMVILVPLIGGMSGLYVYADHGVGGAIAGATVGAGVVILCAQIVVKIIREIGHMIVTFAGLLVIIAIAAWYFWDVRLPSSPEPEQPTLTRPS
jgi:hypothetical protein